MSADFVSIKGITSWANVTYPKSTLHYVSALSLSVTSRQVTSRNVTTQEPHSVAIISVVKKIPLPNFSFQRNFIFG